MLSEVLTAGITLSLVDRASEGILALGGRMEKLTEKQKAFNEVAKWSAIAGAAVLGSYGKTIQVFSQLESAQTQLQSTIMDSSGTVSSMFGELDDIAKRLGTDLPGSTEDFYNMASRMLALGVSQKTVAGGALEAAAKLGVVLKPLGVSYDEAAESVAKFSEALGIAQSDLVPFMDTIQRTAHMGVNLGELRFALAGVSSSLGKVGLQGLDAANGLAPLMAMLIKSNVRSEVVGTGMREMFESFLEVDKVDKANKSIQSLGISLEFVDRKTGQFLGIENMMGQFDKLKGLNPIELQKVMTTLFPSAPAQAVASKFAEKGVSGLQLFTAEMERQASLDQRVQLRLGTLASAFDALSGTVRGFAGMLGGLFGPELKKITGWLNEFVGWLTKVGESNDGATRKFVGLVLATSALAVAFGGITMALRVYRSIQAVSTILLGRATIATAANTAAVATNAATTNAASLGIWGMSKALGTGLMWGLGKAVLGIRMLSLAIWNIPGIGWILAIVSALIGLSIWLYNTFEPVKKFFDGIWEIIKKVGRFVGGVLGFTVNETTGNSVAATGTPIADLGVAPTTETNTSLGATPTTPASGNGVTVNYSPTITIDSTADKEKFRDVLRAHSKEIVRMVEDSLRQNRRSDYVLQG